MRDRGGRHVDYPGALLCALGLGGPVFALIEQPRLGWSSPAVSGPLIAGVAAAGDLHLYESRAKDPMLPLVLFRRRNFSAGNIETFAMYAGLSILFFFLVLFLQQIGGYTPLQSGLATLPATMMMFVLSRRFGALADRFGPRFFMGVGPLVAAGGLLLFQMTGVKADYVSEVLPPLLIFSLGLSMTVAPLTAAVLAGLGEGGRASPRVSTTRSRASRGYWARRRSARRLPASFASSLDDRPGGEGAWGRGACGGCRKPSACRWGARKSRACRSAQAHAVTVAAEGASLHSFHLGHGDRGGAGRARRASSARLESATPSARRSYAEHCAGGQLVGASSDIELAGRS